MIKLRKNKQAIRIIVLILAMIGMVLFMMGYVKFILHNRGGVLIGCTILIITIMGIQCVLKYANFKSKSKSNKLHKIK